MKKYLMGLIVVVSGLTIFAFTTQHIGKSKPLSGEKWFHFIGSNNVPADLTNPDKYTLDNDGSEPTVCASEDSYRCEILILPDGSGTKPDLTKMVIDETGRSTP